MRPPFCRVGQGQSAPQSSSAVGVMSEIILGAGDKVCGVGIMSRRMKASQLLAHPLRLSNGRSMPNC